VENIGGISRIGKIGGFPEKLTPPKKGGPQKGDFLKFLEKKVLGPSPKGRTPPNFLPKKRGDYKGVFCERARPRGGWEMVPIFKGGV